MTGFPPGNWNTGDGSLKADRQRFLPAVMTIVMTFGNISDSFRCKQFCISMLWLWAESNRRHEDYLDC